MSNKLTTRLRSAIESGKDLDRHWDGEDEVQVEVYNTNYALELVLDVFKVHLKEAFFAGREVENIHDIDGTTLAKDVKPKYSWNAYLNTLGLD